jgi:hypothetical protein
MQKSLAFVRGFFVFCAPFLPHRRQVAPFFVHANSLMSFSQLSFIRCGAYAFLF